MPNIRIFNILLVYWDLRIQIKHNDGYDRTGTVVLENICWNQLSGINLVLWLSIVNEISGANILCYKTMFCDSRSEYKTFSNNPDSWFISKFIAATEATANEM